MKDDDKNPLPNSIDPIARLDTKPVEEDPEPNTYDEDLNRRREMVAQKAFRKPRLSDYGAQDWNDHYANWSANK